MEVGEKTNITNRIKSVDNPKEKIDHLKEAVASKSKLPRKLFLDLDKWVESDKATTSDQLEYCYSKAQYMQMISNDFHAAIDACKQGLGVSKSKGVSEDRVRFYRALGINYYLLGKYERSLEYNYLAIEHIEKSQKDYPEEKAAIFNNISIVFTKKEDSAARKFYLEKAIEQYDILNNVRGQVKCLINLGNMASTQEDYPAAIKNYNEASQLLQEDPDKHLEATILNNLGYVYYHTKELSKALDTVGKAIKIKRSLPDKHSQVLSEITLAEIHMAMESYKVAAALLEDVLVKAKQIDVAQEVAIILNLLSEAYAKNRRYKSAYEVQLEFNKIKDTLFNMEKERNLIEANAKFQSKLLEREDELKSKKESELKEYAKKLEHSNRDLKMFAQLSAHDIKEPIRMININLGFLKQRLWSNLDQTEQQLLDFAFRSSNNLSDIINDVLILTKLDSSKPELDTCDMNKLIEEIKDNLQPICYQKGVVCEIDDIPDIVADVSQIKLLFHNLLENAITYNQAETPLIEITYEEGDTHHNFEIKDNGEGIPESLIENIFEPFTRSEVSGKEQQPGTGVGLSICKRVVEHHKGKIKIKSRKDGGTTVQFTIKRA